MASIHALSTGSRRLRERKRFSTAMWDFSWLVRRDAQESEYANWGHVLAELQERGYDSVRIDPFPHLVCNHSLPDDFRIEPLHPTFMWGNHQTVHVQPAESLRQFLRAISGTDLLIGLSSWFLSDSQSMRDRILSSSDLARAWCDTLRLFQEEDVFDRIIWVDLCNEFPMSIWLPTAYEHIFNTTTRLPLMPSALSLVVPWSRKSCERFQKYMNGAISAVRKEYPQLNYTFSCQEFGALQLRRLDLSQLDLIEVHLWASDDILWSMLSGHVWAAFATSQRGIVAHQKQARWAVKHFRQYSERVLERNMTFWTQLAERWEIPLVTSEGWVSTFYDDTSTSGNPDDWTWLKDLTQMAVRKAVKKGWTGICTSNFCQPHFEGMWSDSEWHRKTTSIIRGD